MKTLRFDSDMKHPNSCAFIIVPVVRIVLCVNFFFFCFLACFANHGNCISHKSAVMFMSGRDWLYFRCNTFYSLKNMSRLRGECMTKTLTVWQLHYALHSHGAVTTRGMSYHSCLHCLSIFTDVCTPASLLNYTPATRTLWLISIFVLF